MKAPSCRRCGTCCRKGGPALHMEDTSLLESIGLTELICLRVGEPAFDPRRGSVQPLQEEVIKVRGKGNSWECVYYDSDGQCCGIYSRRPLECRALSCEHSDGIFRAMGSALLNRSHFVQPGSALWECITEHDRRYPVTEAVALADRMRAGGQIQDELDYMLRAETAFRHTLARRVQAADQDLWAYLGRPLWLVLMPYGSVFSRYGDVE